MEPGGAEGTTTANEASVGQSIPRPRRVSIRCFFSLLVDRDTEGCFRTRHPKKINPFIGAAVRAVHHKITTQGSNLTPIVR